MFRLPTQCYIHGIQIVVLVDGNPTALNQSERLSRLARIRHGSIARPLALSMWL